MNINEAIEHAKEIYRNCEDINCAFEHGQLANWLQQLKELKAILGDDYDLKRLKELVEACKGLEPKEIVESKLLIATRKDPKKLARMAVLTQADKEGRCVVLPCKDWLELVFGNQEIFYAIDEEEEKIKEIIVRNEERFIWFDDWKSVIFNGIDSNGLEYEFSPEAIGKNIFLSYEEAEQVLKERKEKNEMDKC